MGGRLLSVVRDSGRIFNDTRFALLPVLCCVALTQLFWTEIYDCKQTKQIFSEDRRNDVGLVDAILASESWKLLDDGWNDVVYYYGVPTVLAPFVGALIVFAVLNPSKIYEAWETLAHIGSTFLVFGTVFYDGVAQLPVDSSSQLPIATIATLSYGTGWFMMMKTNRLSASCCWLYAVTSAALFSVLYLSALPNIAVWGVLIAVIVFDFARSNYKSLRNSAPSPFENTEFVRQDEIDYSIVTRNATRRLAAGRDGVLLQRTELARAAWTEAPWALQPAEDNDEGYSDSDSLGSYGSSTSTCREYGWIDGIDDLEERTGVGLSCLSFFAGLLGKSMAVGGVLHALPTTFSLLCGVAFTMSSPECVSLPVTATGLISGMLAHFLWIFVEHTFRLFI